uniref:THAP-type domain-containing protein n=1 Tax=Ixodes ricinus TaxID=34613 RepID=V5HNH9_IXORI
MSSNRSNLQFSSHRSCSVPQCTNRSVRGKISLHRFPTDARLREAWRAKLRINKLITTHMQVCSIHFLRHDFFWSAADGRNCPIPKKQRLKRGAIPSQFLPVENPGRRPANLKSQCRARKKTSQKPCQKPRESKPTDGEDQQEAVPQGESFGLQSCSPLRHEEATSGDLVQAEQLAHTERSDTGCGNSWLPPDTTEASVLDKVGELVNAIPGLRPGMLLAFRIPQGRGNPTEKHQRAPGREPCWPVALYRHGDSPDCWPAPQHGASPESENVAVQAAPRCEQLITGDTTGTRALDADFTSQEQAVGNSVCRGLFAGNGRCTGIPEGYS